MSEEICLMCGDSVKGGVSLCNMCWDRASAQVEPNRRGEIEA